MNNFAPLTRKLLAKAGWQLLRQGKGDHEIWHDPTTGRKVTVDSSIKSRHTANAILKFAGLPKAF
ncbi:type II toxin-antitoxin system HicA family toxin [Mesorhizobium koreense]|uniref:type II toxin-antitoxin system HicA family toxin n=1 Tax=Mesorhizobium koreense TaxID=3074855 RepID=UPI00287BA90F|nr:type II toxin-antitoxin system HicA family toxin [Mesorhizobium sp. WR6]